MPLFTEFSLVRTTDSYKDRRRHRISPRLQCLLGDRAVTSWNTFHRFILANPSQLYTTPLLAWGNWTCSFRNTSRNENASRCRVQIPSRLNYSLFPGEYRNSTEVVQHIRNRVSSLRIGSRAYQSRLFLQATRSCLYPGVAVRCSSAGRSLFPPRGEKLLMLHEASSIVWLSFTRRDTFSVSCWSSLPPSKSSQ